LLQWDNPLYLHPLLKLFHDHLQQWADLAYPSPWLAKPPGTCSRCAGARGKGKLQVMKWVVSHQQLANHCIPSYKHQLRCMHICHGLQTHQELIIVKEVKTLFTARIHGHSNRCGQILWWWLRCRNMHLASGPNLQADF
jgi:hypothetical protein